MSQSEHGASSESSVAVEASVRAKKLVVRRAPRARVSFRGDGHVRTERRGIPPTGTEDGQEYRDVFVQVGVRARRPPDGDRASDRAPERG